MLHSTLQLFSLLSNVTGEEKKTNDYLQLVLVKKILIILIPIFGIKDF
jgi:hypothetical protein